MSSLKNCTRLIPNKFWVTSIKKRRHLYEIAARSRDLFGSRVWNLQKMIYLPFDPLIIKEGIIWNCIQSWMNFLKSFTAPTPNKASPIWTRKRMNQNWITMMKTLSAHSSGGEESESQRMAVRNFTAAVLFCRGTKMGLSVWLWLRPHGIVLMRRNGNKTAPAAVH